MELLGHTLDAIGKIMIAYTALRVHHRFWQEHQTDQEVFRAMKQEQKIGLSGIALIIAGYLLQLPSLL